MCVDCGAESKLMGLAWPLEALGPLLVLPCSAIDFLK